MTGKPGAAAGGLYLHILVLAIVIVSELIGIQRLSIGLGTVIFLPILYAFALGIMLNPAISRRAPSSFPRMRSSCPAP